MSLEKVLILITPKHWNPFELINNKYLTLYAPSYKIKWTQFFFIAKTEVLPTLSSFHCRAYIRIRKPRPSEILKYTNRSFEWNLAECLPDGKIFT